MKHLFYIFICVLCFETKGQNSGAHLIIGGAENNVIISFKDEPISLDVFTAPEPETSGLSNISFPDGALALYLGMQGVYNSSSELVFTLNEGEVPVAILPSLEHEDQFVFVFSQGLGNISSVRLQYVNGIFKVDGEVTSFNGALSSYHALSSVATYSPNGGIWLYLYNFISNSLDAFYYSSAGFSQEPIRSNLPANSSFITSFSLSRDGRYILGTSIILELSPHTGEVIDSYTLPNEVDYNWEDVCFSSSGEWLYAMQSGKASSGKLNERRLVRYSAAELFSKAEADFFLSTEEVIYSFQSNHNFNMIHLAHDDKIYFTSNGDLYRIENSNSTFGHIGVKGVIAGMGLKVFPSVLNSRPVIIPQYQQCFSVELHCVGDGIFNYRWNFGDGSEVISSESAIVRHTYATHGEYKVVLDVKYADNTTYTLQQIIKVNECTQPLVSVEGNCVGIPSKFVNYGVSGDIKFYLWNFGDGTSSTEHTPSHKYTSAGTYTVTLTVTHTDNTTETLTKEITIYSAPSTSTIQHEP